MSEQLHKVQVSILSALRHTEAARFSTLMRPTALQSDTFKFHLRKLIKLGYVEKSAAGQYQLTTRGKEFANNLDETKRTLQRQPKLSILLIVRKPGEHDEPLFLFQRRRRKPFFDFWSCIGGPIQWGEYAEETAARELKKQTGLSAVCKVRSFYHIHDYDESAALLLEDKLFVILEGTEVRGALSNDWYAGHNAWMTVDEFKRQPKYFPSVCKAMELIAAGQGYVSQKVRYSQEEY